MAAKVVERSGCDANPIDPTTDEGRTTILSYVWPDQAERLALARAACDVARRVSAVVEQADAPDWSLPGSRIRHAASRRSSITRS